MTPNPIKRQQGVALVMVLCIVLALMLVGLSAARSAIQAEKAARGERDRHIAFAAAEAALGDAERDIEGGSDAQSARARLFSSGSAIDFVPGCGSGQQLGLCARTASPAPPAWHSAQLAAVGVAYGHFTGFALPAGRGTLTARPPRYIIEQLPFTRAGASAQAGGASFYRITAIGFGASERTQVVLQAFYLKPDSGEDA